MKISPHPDLCPSCGSDPKTSDHDHRDECPRIDTCGQFGPPWVVEDSWHPLEGDLEPTGEQDWLRRLSQHYLEVDHLYLTEEEIAALNSSR